MLFEKGEMWVSGFVFGGEGVYVDGVKTTEGFEGGEKKREGKGRKGK